MKKWIFILPPCLTLRMAVFADTYKKVTDSSVEITREVKTTVNISVLENQLLQIQAKRQQIQQAYDQQMLQLDQLQTRTQTDIDSSKLVGVSIDPSKGTAVKQP